MSRQDRFMDSMHRWCEEMDMHYGQGNSAFPLPRYEFEYGGSTDCSAMAAHCLREAGYDIPGSVWSGNIADCLEEIGWTRSYDDGLPPHGAVLVNYANHVATWDGRTNQIVEFGGDPHYGYRTTHGFYDYPWDCYVCPPDDNGTSEPVSEPSSTMRYRVMTREDGWLDWMNGTTCTCPDPSCTDDFAGIEGHWIYGFDANFHFKAILMDGSESPWVMRWDDCGQAIRGICVEDAKYQAHFCGSRWGKVENGMTDGGAGDDVHALDMIRVW